MRHVPEALLLLALLAVAACGAEVSKPPPAVEPVTGSGAEGPVAPEGPEDVVRRWLHAAKRGDAAAMVALRVEEQRAEVGADPRSFAGHVASGALHAASWQLGATTGTGAARAVTAHVLWRELPDGGDNLEFRCVQRDGRWWLVDIVHFD